MIRLIRGSWEVRVYAGRDPVSGRPRTVSRSIKAKPGQTKPPKAARDLEAAMKVRYGNGNLDSDATVAEVIESWLAQVSPELSPWTVRGYRGVIDRYIVPNLGAVKLRRLTPDRIEGFYLAMRESGGERANGIAPATIRQCHAVLRRALARAVRLRQISVNPAASAEPPSIPHQERAVPGAQDVEALLAACRDDIDLRDLVLLADQTGARAGEVCGIRWADVNLETGEVAIRRAIADPGGEIIVKSTKGRKVRVVPVGPVLVAALKARRSRAASEALAAGVALHPDAYVLSEVVDGTIPLRPERASGRFRALAKRAGVACRLHDLRHAHATDLAAAGVPITDVAARLGHASAKMTLDVYGHPTSDGARHAAQVADARRHRG